MVTASRRNDSIMLDENKCTMDKNGFATTNTTSLWIQAGRYWHMVTTANLARLT